ncbi:MAG: DUF2723 domain-containing protein [Candidatus Desantisbacteria bacterium]
MKKGWLTKCLPGDEPINSQPFEKIDYACGLLVLFVSFGVYLWTLMPTVGLYDGADMTAAAWVLGIPHPPGYPFYSLLGKVWMTILPIGNLAMRLNMLAALSGALIAFFSYFITLKIIGTQSAIARIIPSVSSALTLAFTVTIWQQATFAGQYLFNLAFASLVIFIVIKWGKLSSRKYLYLLAFLLGLSLGHHRQTLFLLPGTFFFILIISWKNRIREKIKLPKEKWAKLVFPLYSKILFIIRLPYTLRLTPSTLIIMLLLFLLPISIYLYLPISAASSPPINWSNPNTLTRFLETINGERYSFLFAKIGALERILEAIKQTRSFFICQFTFYPLLFGLLGIVVMAIRRVSCFLLLAIIFLTDILVSVSYRHPSIELYYMIPSLIGSIWIGFGIWGIICALSKNLRLLGIIFLLIPLFPALSNYKINNRSRYYFTYDYALNTIKPLRENAVLILTGSDLEVFNIWYFRYVERLREDVVLVEPHNFHFEWAVANFKKAHPDIPFELYPVKKEVLSFNEVKWQRIEDMVKKNLQNRPFYIFPGPGILTEYEFIPEGIFANITKSDIPKEELLRIVDEDRMNMVRYRTFQQNSCQDSTAQVCITNTAVAYFNRGRLYYNLGQWEKAILELKKAIKVDPSYDLAKSLLSQIYKEQARK